MDTTAVFDEMERDLMGGPTPHDDPKGKPLYHYTDAYGFAGILKNKKLWATHFRHLNDKEEIAAGERIVHEESETLATSLIDREKWFIENFRAAHAKMSLSKIAEIFVASLTEEGDLLSQWRGYGDRTSGYALGFSRLRLPDPSAPPNPDATQVLHLAKCTYDEDKYRLRLRHVLVEVARGFSRFIDRHATTEADGRSIASNATAIALRRVGLVVPSYKVPAFKEEAEWRLIAIPTRGHEDKICFRAARGVIVPYLEIDLCEEHEQIGLDSVVLGPTVEPVPGTNGARMLLKREGYNPDLVRPSTIPFRG